MSQSPLNPTDEFDKFWIINSETTTYNLFIKDVDEKLLEILDESQRGALKQLAAEYRKFESKRWEKEGMEKYHTHGIYSAWVVLDIISHFSKGFESILSKEGAITKGKCFETFKGTEIVPHVFYTMIIAAMLHDIGGVLKGVEVSASPSEKEIKAFLGNIPMVKEDCIVEITRFAKLTDYRSENPIYFRRDGRLKFLSDQVSLQGLVVIAADLLQIGALDYSDRVSLDLKLPVNTFPPVLLLLLANVLKTLANRISVQKPIGIIPMIIRERVLKVFKDFENYGWEQAPRDYLTGKKLLNPKTKFPWQKEEFRDYLLTLLGVLQ